MHIRGAFSEAWGWCCLTIVLAQLSIICGAHIGLGREITDSCPPKTRRDNVKEVLHGVTIVDPYRWLEDQQSPETRAWIDAENKCTRKLLGGWSGREALKHRLAELMKVDTVEVPWERNHRYFFKKRMASQDQGVLFMRRGLEGRDEVLVDPNSLSPDHTISVNFEEVSEDGRLIAYGIRQGGADEVAIHWLDADTRSELPDRLPKGLYFGVAMKSDKSGFYYTHRDTEGPRLYFHTMGTPTAEDKRVFGEGYGPDKIIYPMLSEDGRYLVVHVLYGSAADKTEVYVQDLKGNEPLCPVVNDVDARFIAEIGGDTLFLHTNWKAPKGRILAVDLRNPSREHWREVVPEGSAVIDSFSAAAQRLFVNYTENASSHVKVFDASGHYLQDLELPALGSVFSFAGRWANKEVFFGFTSFATPLTIFRREPATGKQEAWARERVPIRSDKFEVRQVWYESKDKTRVPMFLVHRKGLKFDGSIPTLLTGYGGFNLNNTPYFSTAAAIWAENGGIFALANLRGGGEFGEQWHKAGMLSKKQNVFDDFIAAAEWLIKNGHTKPTRLAIEGRSNGGLLVGAALTQRPELFGAAACGYPLLDMVRYHKFLVARYWVSEYGSADDPEQFKYIYAYSPYHHVRQGTKYPAVVFFSGDSDTRVAPLHARKMTALLQSATTSGRPVLLRYDTEAGHSRALPVSKQIDESTDVIGFLLMELGVPFPNPHR